MTDARTVLATLRPQAFGKGRTDRVPNPIVEPQWAGIRALAAVDHAGAVLRDDTGELIDDRPEIVSTLSSATFGSEVVLDGFLTKQATQDTTSIDVRTDVVPNVQISVGRLFFGWRRNRAAEAAQARLVLRQAETLAPEDTISYVAIDLLWLDGESLIDIPLLERRRLLDVVLAESQLIRRGAFVRPPIDNWIRSWRAQGFVGLTFRAANSRYVPGVASEEWATAPMPR